LVQITHINNHSSRNISLLFLLLVSIYSQNIIEVIYFYNSIEKLDSSKRDYVHYWMFVKRSLNSFYQVIL
jgi:hypothetical protein